MASAFKASAGEIPAATHSSILAWKIPWMEEPGGLQSMGSWRVGHDWESSLFHFSLEWLPWEALPPSTGDMLPICFLAGKLDPLTHCLIYSAGLSGLFPSHSSYRAQCPCLQEPLVSLTSSHLPHLTEGHRGTSRIPPRPSAKPHCCLTAVAFHACWTLKQLPSRNWNGKWNKPSAFWASPSADQWFTQHVHLHQYEWRFRECTLWSAFNKPQGVSSSSPLASPPHISIIFSLPLKQTWSFPAQYKKYKGHKFNPWVGRIPWRRTWQPTLVFLSGESHGQRRLVGYSP